MATAASVSFHPVPGPTGSRWKRIREARRDVLGFLLKAAIDHGGLVCLREGRTYLAAGPDYVKHVLQDNHPNYVKGPKFRNALGPIIGDGLITVDGEQWRRQRQRSQPYFLKKGHAEYVEKITPFVAGLCDRLASPARSNAQVNLTEEIGRFALAAHLHTTCSGEADNDVDALIAAFAVTADSLDPVAGFNPLKLPAFIPTPGRIRLRKAIESADGVIHRLIRNRRNNPNPPQDLLSGLIFDRDDDLSSDKQIRDEIMTMFHSGFETSADQIIWNLVALADQPEIARRLKDEVDGVLCGRIATFSDLENLPYLHMVLQETMRLRPAAWGYFRQAIGDDYIDGFCIPANSIVLISAYVTHRLPSVWEHAEEFRPERFRPEEFAKQHRFAFFPFGAGPRHCIGGGLAALLISVTVAALLQRFAIYPLPGQQIRAVPRLSLKPEPAFWARLSARTER